MKESHNCIHPIMSSRMRIWTVSLRCREKNRRRTGRRTIKKGESRIYSNLWSWHTPTCLWLCWLCWFICRNPFSCRGVYSVANLCTWRQSIDSWRFEETRVVFYTSWGYLLSVSRFCECCMCSEEPQRIGRIEEAIGSSNAHQDWYRCHLFGTSRTECGFWYRRCRERISRHSNPCHENLSLILIWMITLQ